MNFRLSDVEHEVSRLKSRLHEKASIEDIRGVKDRINDLENEVKSIKSFLSELESRVQGLYDRPWPVQE